MLLGSRIESTLQLWRNSICQNSTLYPSHLKRFTKSFACTCTIAEHDPLAYVGSAVAMLRCWQVASSPPPFSSKTRPRSSYPPHPVPTLGRRGGFLCGLLVVDFPRGQITSRRVSCAYWLATRINDHFKVGNLPITSIISNTMLLLWRFERHPVSWSLFNYKTCLFTLWRHGEAHHTTFVLQEWASELSPTLPTNCTEAGHWLLQIFMTSRSSTRFLRLR
jgi:hypothetical protein